MTPKCITTVYFFYVKHLGLKYWLKIFLSLDRERKCSPRSRSLRKDGCSSATAWLRYVFGTSMCVGWECCMAMVCLNYLCDLWPNSFPVSASCGTGTGDCGTWCCIRKGRCNYSVIVLLLWKVLFWENCLVLCFFEGLWKEVRTFLLCHFHITERNLLFTFLFQVLW